MTLQRRYTSMNAQGLKCLSSLAPLSLQTRNTIYQQPSTEYLEFLRSLSYSRLVNY
jgi:hypothetical protein